MGSGGFKNPPNPNINTMDIPLLPINNNSNNNDPGTTAALIATAQDYSNSITPTTVLGKIRKLFQDIWAFMKKHPKMIAFNEIATLSLTLTLYVLRIIFDDLSGWRALGAGFFASYIVAQLICTAITLAAVALHKKIYGENARSFEGLTGVYLGKAMVVLLFMVAAVLINKFPHNPSDPETTTASMDVSAAGTSFISGELMIALGALVVAAMAVAMVCAAVKNYMNEQSHVPAPVVGLKEMEMVELGVQNNNVQDNNKLVMNAYVNVNEVNDHMNSNSSVTRSRSRSDQR